MMFVPMVWNDEDDMMDLFDPEKTWRRMWNSFNSDSNWMDGMKTDIVEKEKDQKSGRVLRQERSTANYQRSFRVDEDVKPEDISAKYENGVLTLTLPKKEAVETKADDTKRIEIH